MGKHKPVRIAILASGGGSNARALLQRFQGSEVAEVALLATQNPDSGVVAMGPEYAVPVVVFPTGKHRDGNYLNEVLQQQQVDLIVLAGYLKKIPDETVVAFPQRIINIHPSLLPDYGGKGMYGMHVHRAVIEAGEARSGMTIHYVNEVYDEGQIIFQESLVIAPQWTPKELQQAVLKLEHTYYPLIVEKVAKTVQIADN